MGKCKNRYDLGSFMDGVTQGKGLTKTPVSAAASSAMSAIGNAVGGMAGSALSGGMESGAGNVIGSLGKMASAIPGPYGAIASAALQAVGGLTNRAFGSKLNQEQINAANNNISQLNNFNSNAASFDDLAASGQPATMGFNKSMIGKDGWFADKAAKKYKALKAKQAEATANALASIDNNIDNLVKTQNDDMLANYSAFGGILSTQGADFNTGLNYINNGGTHESNPYEGIPVSVDPEGKPNLVEEGETVFDNYVFSNRLKVPKEFLNKYKLGGKQLTFAEASKKLNRELEDRPNDYISKRTTMENIQALAEAQEQVRFEQLSPEEQAMAMQQMQAEQQGNQAACGGKLHGLGGNLFGEGTQMISFEQVYPNGLQVPNYDFQLKAPTEFNLPIQELDQSMSRVPTKTKSDTYSTWLRYAPVLGAAIGIGDHFWNKPSYTDANKVENAAIAASNYDRVSFNPLGDYLTYNPMDRLFAQNQLNAAAGAGRRGILNTSGGNRGTAMAGMLAADNNYMNQTGNLFRQAQEYNEANRQKVAEFNRATNQYNSEGFLKADMANQSARQQAMGQYLTGINQAMALRNATDTQRATAFSANLSNLFNSLGAIGKENMARNMIITDPSKYYTVDAQGRVTYKGAFDEIEDADFKSSVERQANRDSRAAKRSYKKSQKGK